MIDITGQRFGRLVAIERVGTDKHRKAVWLCQCDCGNTTKVTGNELRRGRANSCGCYCKERNREAHVKHGGRYTRLYDIWRGFRQRCSNPNAKGYSNYGGRGITVCPEWDDFTVFQKWAHENGYTDSMTIERKDVNGNYEPSNCTWILQAEQEQNKQDTIRVDGMSLKKYCRMHNISYWKALQLVKHLDIDTLKRS